MRMLNGFFDIDNRLEHLTENGDILPNLKKLVPREDFRGELEVICAHECKSNAGCRPFDVVMMFKNLILQSLYSLSDDEMGYLIMDRLSFMRFLDLDSRVPDAKTIWLFRSKLEGHKLIRKLFDKFNAFLAQSGFAARSETGITQYRMQHGPILHFDAAECITWRILQKKSNKMSTFSVVET